MTPDPGVFGSLLVTALWLAAVGLLAAWWSDGAIGWATLREAAAAAGLAFWALGESRARAGGASIPAPADP